MDPTLSALAFALPVALGTIAGVLRIHFQRARRERLELERLAARNALLEQRASIPEAEPQAEPQLRFLTDTHSSE